jgi:lipoyl(octanoyl) transferase
VKPILATWLGRVAYKPAFELQRVVAELRAEDKLPDTLLLLEHEHVYTLGRRGTRGEILWDAETLSDRGVEVVPTDRGGRVTYHGPGQLVGYPIMNLGAAPDLCDYVRRLERAMIGSAGDFGVKAAAIDGLPGIWAGGGKLGAIGVHVARGITTHGFAINVTTDLDLFNGIIPCGIADRGVTSLEALTGSGIGMDAAVSSMVKRFGEAFGREVALVEMSFEEVADAR